MTMKRFWKQSGVLQQGGVFCVALDGRAMKTPAGRDFVCPNHGLAAAIAAEWNAVHEVVNPQNMPMTQLAATALDVVAVRRGEIICQIAGYAETDLLCYRAAQPEALAARQAALWQPYLDWAMQRHDAVLKTTTGVQPVRQSAQAVAALRRAVESLDDFRLSALQCAVSGCGSLVLGLALIEGWQDAEAVFAAAELEADFQIEKWGMDEATAQQQNAVKTDILAVEKFVRLLSA